MNQDSGQALLGRNAELEAEIARLRRALEAAKQNTTRLEAKLGRAEARGRAELTSMRAMVAAAQASGSATRKLVHEAKAEAGRAALEGRAKLAAADAMERKLRLALAAGDMGIWERRGASGDLALDERCRGLFGLPHDAPVTLNGLLERVHPSDRAAVRAAVLALSEPGVAAGDLAIEFGVSDPDNDAAEGRWVAMLARAPAGAKKRGGGGTPERVLGAVRDVTEQKHAAACFDALADLVPGLLWSNDPRGVTGWYNRRWFEFTGQAPEDARGYGWLDVIHPDDRDRSRRGFQDAVDAGRPLQQEHRIRRAVDGAWHRFRVEARPVRGAGGRILRWYGCATDLGEERSAAGG